MARFNDWLKDHKILSGLGTAIIMLIITLVMQNLGACSVNKSIEPKIESGKTINTPSENKIPEKKPEENQSQNKSVINVNGNDNKVVNESPGATIKINNYK